MQETLLLELIKIWTYLKLNHINKTADLLNNAFANSLIPTITKPTRIAHASATLIDNIYVKFKLKHKLKFSYPSD